MRSTRTTAWALITMWLVAVGAGLAPVVQAATVAASQAAAQPAPAGQEPQGEFMPVKTLPAHEQLPAAPLVMAAYGFVWAVLLVYVWSVWRRLMKVEHEIRDLSARLGQKR